MTLTHLTHVIEHAERWPRSTTAKIAAWRAIAGWYKQLHMQQYPAVTPAIEQADKLIARFEVSHHEI